MLPGLSPQFMKTLVNIGYVDTSAPLHQRRALRNNEPDYQAPFVQLIHILAERNSSAKG